MNIDFLFPEHILSERLESQYRCSNLGVDSFQSRLWIGVISLPLLLAGGVAALDSGEPTLIMLTTGGLLALLTGAVLLQLPRLASHTRVDLLLLAWWIAAISHWQQLVMAAELRLVLDVLALVFVYLMIPNRLVLQLAAALLLTLLESRQLQASALGLTTIGLLWLANPVLFVLTWRFHRLRRCMYCSHKRENKLMAHIDKLNQCDSLTGVYNRRVFLERCANELGRYQRYGRPMSLLLLVLEDFKRVNEIHGHQAGDELLMAFARIMGENTREQDVLGRLAGQEFAICLPETGLTNARELGERIRRQTGAEVVPWNDERLRLKVTVGVTLAEPADQRPTDLLARADKELVDASAAAPLAPGDEHRA